MADDDAGRILTSTHRRNHAAAKDFAARMKTDGSDDIAEFGVSPINETVVGAPFVVLNGQPGAPFNSATLFLPPVPHKLKRCNRSHAFLLSVKRKGRDQGCQNVWI